ncbi:hypothetical protein OOK41_08995 [Micromonospora sp. NBC_01655]|uniref:hypothetical protein n=1 Tax=Micromonospora sp. NBC_01655 TaxID=2975983 RepID=UPI00224D801F|nr:hypothetical protein [Micromonospora sp. NBC_01655]MCX4470441.1 hypothetical protein [Micromonospora sp. NBC_01655]
MSADESVEQIAYPEGVTSAEVLAELLTVRWRDSDGTVVWEGKLEDPEGGS